MAGFSATDAALEGFRIMKERPVALVACSIFTFMIGVIGALIEVNMPPEARQAMAAIQGEETMDMGPFLEALAITSPILLFDLIVLCVMAAAVYRILLHGEVGWRGYFRLGITELRLVALTLIYGVLFVVLVALAVFAAALVGMLSSAFGQALTVLLSTVAWLAALGGVVFVVVRMSLAPVITFERGKLALVESWPVTRGQFWRLTGAYVLALACIVVAAMLALLVFLPVAGIAILASGGTLADLGKIVAPPEPTYGAYLDPLRLAYMAVSSVFNALWFAVVAAPGAYAYRALTLGAGARAGGDAVAPGT